MFQIGLTPFLHLFPPSNISLQKSQHFSKLSSILSKNYGQNKHQNLQSVRQINPYNVYIAGKRTQSKISYWCETGWQPCCQHVCSSNCFERLWLVAWEQRIYSISTYLSKKSAALQRQELSQQLNSCRSGFILLSRSKTGKYWWCRGFHWLFPQREQKRTNREGQKDRRGFCSLLFTIKASTFFSFKFFRILRD